MVTAQQHPPIEVKCNFAYDIHLQVQVATYKRSKLHEILRMDALAKSWYLDESSDPHEDLCKVQRKYIGLLITTIMCRWAQLELSSS